ADRRRETYARNVLSAPAGGGPCQRSSINPALNTAPPGSGRGKANKGRRRPAPRWRRLPPPAASSGARDPEQQPPPLHFATTPPTGAAAYAAPPVKPDEPPLPRSLQPVAAARPKRLRHASRAASPAAAAAGRRGSINVNPQGWAEFGLHRCRCRVATALF